MKRMIIGIAAGALLSGTVVMAQTRAEKRSDNQQERIDKGRADGSLTEREANRLDKQQDALDRKIERDKADGGGFTAKEKRQAERRQDNLSKRIAKQRHDKQRK